MSWPVEFNGKVYFGYWAWATTSFVLDVLRPQGEKALHEDLAAIRHMPQPWRFVPLKASSCSQPTISWPRRTSSTARTRAANITHTWTISG